MKRTLFLLLVLTLVLLPATASDVINLTPAPKSMTVGDGRYVLPTAVTVDVSAVGDSLKAEAEKLAAVLRVATGREVTVGNAAKADIRLLPGDATMAAEGYRLTVTADGAVLTAATTAGCWYGLQTIKKLLPANVMAGVADETVTEYALPFVDIDDAPRFAYRGFMLDVSRHFFDVAEVKRMIDMMAAYKLNRFHWHLTDDQGWRVEIKKYPRLTSVGSIAPDAYIVDRQYGSYWLNSAYGPYFYTQDELRDVVAYAAERHIEVIPEIDMPGHFVAAMAAYPEFSCNPGGDHTIWTQGGVSSDVLNVANPDAVQMARDILTEIMDIFPSPLIHIGGDECPTGAWEGNAQCKALVQTLGLDNFRQLQSQFIGWMGDHVAERGRRLVVWNEAISAGGADVSLVAAHNPLVMAWYPCDQSALQAAKLGLENVVTPFGPYYINRKQWPSSNEPQGAGDGTDNLERVYSYVPVPSNVTPAQQPFYTGVQGTFWCEYVATPDYLEYLALPRLLAIAESGWTPADRKDFKAFVQRVCADSTLFNYGHYQYGRHYMTDDAGGSKVMPVPHTADDPRWYRLVNRCGDDGRRGRCIELLHAGSPLISTYSGKGAQANRVWTSTPAAESDEAYDWQLWGFEPDPSGSNRWAMVCKGAPDGSVNPKPTAANTGGRWTYDASRKNYAFILGDNGYGEDDTHHYYSIRSEQVEGQWMNSSKDGQGYAVNLYNNPSDGNSGLWTFLAMNFDESAADTTSVPSAFTGFSEGEVVRITNAVEGFDACALYDRADRNSNYLRHTTDRWVNDAWVVTSVSETRNGVQTAVVRNASTSRALRNAASTAVGHCGFPVTIATTNATKVELRYHDDTGDFTLAVGGKYLFPIPATSTNSTLAGVVSAGSTIGATNAIRPQGNAWHITPAALITWQCVDTEGNDLGTYHCSADRSADYRCEGPVIEGYELLAINGTPLNGTLPTLAAPLADTLVTAVYGDASRVHPTVADKASHRRPWFDLLGRRTDGTRRNTIILNDSKKVLVK